MSLSILFCDDHLAAFAKPAGLLVHRGWGDDDVTAVDLARDALGGIAHPVHRLDRGTSGVILFARSPEIAAKLQAAFERGEVQKTYVALVRGIAPESACVDHPIPRREGGPRVPAVTDVRLLAAASATPGESGLSAEVCRASLVEARPRTGRLHQVRRHLKHLSHPIIGDANYGKGALNRLFREEIGLARLALHAAAIRLLHPVSGVEIEVTADLPEDLRGPLARLGIAHCASPERAAAIVKKPNVCGGRACIAGTRITVWGLVEHRQRGLSDDAILEATPGLDREQLTAAFRYADEHPEEIARDLAENKDR